MTFPCNSAAEFISSPASGRGKNVVLLGVTAMVDTDEL